MIKEVFGYTEEERYECLKKKFIISSLMILSLLAMFLMKDVIDFGNSQLAWLVAILYFVDVFGLIFVWGWTATKKIFKITTILALISGKGIVGMFLFVFYLFVVYFASIFFGCIGIIMFIYLWVKRHHIIRKPSALLGGQRKNTRSVDNSYEERYSEEVSEYSDKENYSYEEEYSHEDGYFEEEDYSQERLLKIRRGYDALENKYGEVKAARIWERAENGDLDVQLSLANLLDESADHQAAYYWYKKAVEKESVEAYFKVSEYLSSGYEGIPQNRSVAMKLLKLAISRNYPPAIYQLGCMYEYGDTVAKDEAKAFKCYVEAAKLGYDPAKEEVGLWYFHGRHVTANEAVAVRLFAQCKDPKYGYYYLANCLAEGLGVAKDKNKAVLCLEKAIANNCSDISDAKRMLYKLYQEGFGSGDIESKKKKLKADLDKGDRLLSELANLPL